MPGEISAHASATLFTYRDAGLAAGFVGLTFAMFPLDRNLARCGFRIRLTRIIFSRMHPRALPGSRIPASLSSASACMALESSAIGATSPTLAFMAPKQYCSRAHHRRARKAWQPRATISCRRPERARLQVWTRLWERQISVVSLGPLDRGVRGRVGGDQRVGDGGRMKRGSSRPVMYRAATLVRPSRMYNRRRTGETTRLVVVTLHLLGN